MGEGDLASCIRCGKAFKTPLEDYAREECEPGALADKLFLDDERKLPIGYNLHAKTVEEAIAHLETHIVWHVSLDHDLDDAHYAFQLGGQNSGGYNAPPRPWDESTFAVKTGYAVLEWMHENDAWVPDIQVHTSPRGPPR